MGRFQSVIFLCIYCAISITVAFGMERPPEIEDGYFNGRSGDMILKPEQYQYPDISMVLLDQTGKILVDDRKEEISIYNVADLIGRSLGVAPIDTKFVASDYIKSKFFNRPMANLLIELDSIGDHIFIDPSIGVKLKYLTALRDGEINGLPVKVTQASYPANSVTLATSLISGRKPSKHGIIAKEWKTPDGSIVHGYSSDDPSTWSQVANLPDLICQTFHGKSLIVSLSGDEQNAKANSVNPTVVKAHPTWTNDYTAHFNTKNMNFIVTSQGNNPAIRGTFEDLTANNIRQIFASHQNSILDSFQEEIKYREGFVSLEYTSDDGTTQYVRYDLTLPQHMLLFAELQGAYSLVNTLKSPNVKTLVEDDFPDFYSISFTSVNSLTEKYGRHSVEVIGALYLFDKTVKIIHDHFSKLYPHRLLSEMVLLGSHPSSLSVNNPDKRPLFSILNRLLPSQNFFDSGLFPSLYIRGTTEKLDENYCEILNLQLKEEEIGFEVYCLPTRPTVHFLEQSIPVSFAEKSTMNSYVDEEDDDEVTVTDADVRKYQIVLWISLLMFFITLFTVYKMAFMTFKKDTLIYSTFNPNWENREARR